MFKLLPKSKYLFKVLSSIRTHFNYLCTIYNRFQEKNFMSLGEIENDLEHFVSDSIFKHLKFDCSSSETALNQQLKLKGCFLVTANSWRSVKSL